MVLFGGSATLVLTDYLFFATAVRCGDAQILERSVHFATAFCGAQPEVFPGGAASECCASRTSGRSRASVSGRAACRSSCVDSMPMIGVQRETPGCSARNWVRLRRRANQTPSNAPRPVTKSNDDGCTRRARMADRTCAKCARDWRFACSMRRSAAPMSESRNGSFMAYPVRAAATPTAAGWRETADYGSSSGKRTGRPPPRAHWPAKRSGSRRSNAPPVKPPTAPRPA